MGQPPGAVRSPGAVPPASAEGTPEREGRVYYSLYMHLAVLDVGGGGASREKPPPPALLTTTTVNVRRAPRKDPDPARDGAIVIDRAPEGTRFEPLPDAPQARLDTADFQWGRVHLEGGTTEAYMTTNEQYLAAADAGPLAASAVPWLQMPEVFRVVTGRNYRRVPRVGGNDPIGLAPPGTQFEALANPPEPEVGQFRWGRVLLTTGPVEAFMSVASPAVEQVRPRQLDTDLLDRLASGGVVAVERPVAAGEVLWEAGPYGLRPQPGSLPEGREPAPLPTVLHWEVFSADNLLADLRRDPAPLVSPPSGDGQAGAPPSPRYSAPQTETLLRVRRAEGPETAEVDREVTFRVADFSAAPTPAQRSQVNWELRVDNQAIGRFMAAGDRLAYTPLPAHAGRTLSAHPFMKSPDDDVAARTRVVAPPPWWTAEDPDADFQVDADRVLDLFEGLDTTILGQDLLVERVTVVVEARREGGPLHQRPSFDPDTAEDPAGHLAYDELAAFYAGDPGGRAARLRHAVCQFESEWGIGDVRAAVDALGVGAPEATTAAVERHQWWAEAVAAGVDLPPAPRLWHYHPLSFLVHVAGTASAAASEDEVAHQSDSAEFDLLVATVYGEAANSSEIAWKAVAHVVMNRVGQREWRRHTTVEAILRHTGFDALTQRNAPFRSAEAHLRGGTVDAATGRRVERMADVLRPVYHREAADSTGGSQLYYSPNAQRALHRRNPSNYRQTPNWNFSLLERASVPGLLPSDDFAFYRYR